MNEIKDVNPLDIVEELGVGKIIDDGFENFNSSFLVPLEKEIAAKNSSDTIAASLYRLGDIYDLMDAPRLSIDAYKRGLSIAESDYHKAMFHREIGIRYSELSNRSLSIENLEKAVACDPHDEQARAELDAVYDDDMKAEDSLWPDPVVLDSSEALAHGDWKKAIGILGKSEDVASPFVRLRAYGGLGEWKSFEIEFRRIIAANSPVDFSYGEWFYISNSIFNSDKFWDLYFECEKHITGVKIEKRFIRSSKQDQ